MGSTSPWSIRQNDLFEQALNTYDWARPDFWQNVARAVGTPTRSAEEVRRHYEELQQDVDNIEAGDLRQFGGRRRGSANTNTNTNTNSNGGSSSRRGGSSRQQRPTMQ